MLTSPISLPTPNVHVHIQAIRPSRRLLPPICRQLPLRLRLTRHTARPIILRKPPADRVPVLEPHTLDLGPVDHPAAAAPERRLPLPNSARVASGEYLVVQLAAPEELDEELAFR